MSKSNVCENSVLLLIFNATTFANIAVNATASPLTDLEWALHTADPGEAGSQTTNEATYGGYARIPVARSGAGHVVTNNSVSPAANVDFPTCVSGGETVTHFSIGTDHTGAGRILYSGTISPEIVVAVGVTPRLTTASTITED